MAVVTIAKILANCYRSAPQMASKGGRSAGLPDQHWRRSSDIGQSAGSCGRHPASTAFCRSSGFAKRYSAYGARPSFHTTLPSTP